MCTSVHLSGRDREEREMQSAVVVACLCLVLPVSTLAGGLSVREEWQSWKEQHGKVFSSEEEETKRLGVWMNNMALIEEHNKQNHSFTLRMNHFGDMV